MSQIVKYSPAVCARDMLLKFTLDRTAANSIRTLRKVMRACVSNPEESRERGVSVFSMTVKSR